MGKNQSASNLTNIIQQDADGSIKLMHGSTMLMQISSSGAITTTGIISGSNALSASYAATSTSSSYALSSTSASYAVSSTSASYAVSATSASYAILATTASSADAFTVRNTLTAQTLVVQTVTSSIVYSSGSNIFGNNISNTQTFTGSLLVTGSSTILGNLGIGGTPGERLSVTGPLGQQGFIRWTDGIATSAFLGITGSTVFIHANNNILGFGANGSNNYSPTMVVSGSNVGIGTTSPTERLSVVGSGLFGSSGIGSYSLVISNNDQSNVRFRLTNTGTDGQSFSIVGGNPGATNSGLAIFDETNSATRLYISSNGNIGLGTSTVTEGTQAAGSISIFPSSSVSSAPLIQFSGNGRIRPASTGDRLSIDGNSLFFNGTFSGNIVMATGGGNVGIGTTGPAATLTVYKTRLSSFTTQTPNQLYIQSQGYDGSGYNTIDFGSTSYGVPLARIGVGVFGDGTYMTFGTSNAYATGITNTALTINPTGNVGIGSGTSGSPNNRLLVQGGNIAKGTTFGYDGAVDNMIKYGAQQDINASGQQLDRWIGIDATVTAGAGSSNIMFFKVYSGGGSGSPRTAAFFNGDGSVFNYNNSTTWQQTSDIKIKDNIRPINGAIEKLCALKPSHFEYKNNLGKTKTGFIAQEFEEVFAGHVTENVPSGEFKQYFEEGEMMKSIDADLIPYLVKAIQELKAENDTLKEILQRNNIQ